MRSCFRTNCSNTELSFASKHCSTSSEVHGVYKPFGWKDGCRVSPYRPPLRVLASSEMIRRSITASVVTLTLVLLCSAAPLAASPEDELVRSAMSASVAIIMAYRADMQLATICIEPNVSSGCLDIPSFVGGECIDLHPGNEPPGSPEDSSFTPRNGHACELFRWVADLTSSVCAQKNCFSSVRKVAVEITSLLASLSQT